MSSLTAVAEELLRDIKNVYAETSNIPDDLLLALKFMFGSSALHALDLVDHRSVTCLSSPSGRKVFQVVGASGNFYTCYISVHYCPCPAFAFSVLRRNESLLVKHCPLHVFTPTVLTHYICVFSSNYRRYRKWKSGLLHSGLRMKVSHLLQTEQGFIACLQIGKTSAIESYIESCSKVISTTDVMMSLILLSGE
uniref:Zinc finger, SWIM-type containing 7 n=1 Tax=Scleropages formosus TaxID=113540 RepID=A0A8C9T7X2_SCLFO